MVDELGEIESGKKDEEDEAMGQPAPPMLQELLELKFFGSGLGSVDD